MDMIFTPREAAMLQARLTAEEKLPAAHAALMTFDALHRYDARVLEGVRLWLDGRLTEDFAVDGVSLADIREQTGLTGFVALGFLDVLLRDRDFAENEVEWFERAYD